MALGRYHAAVGRLATPSISTPGALASRIPADAAGVRDLTRLDPSHQPSRRARGQRIRPTDDRHGG